MSERWSASTGVRVESVLDAESLEPDSADALMWILHEALRNVAAHASAVNVSVLLRAQDDVELHVADDGVGFAVPRSLGSSSATDRGLAGMIRRCEALDGSLEVRSAPGAGTRIIARVPNRMAPSPGAARNHRGRIVVLGAVCLAVLAIAGFFWWPRSSGPLPGAGSAATTSDTNVAPAPAPASGSSPSASPTPATSSPGPSASPTPSSPSPAATTQPAATGSRSTAACTVEYVVHKGSGRSFSADLQITNGKSTSLSSWELRFRFSDGQKVTGTSSGIAATQHGPKVSISGTGSNATLAAHDTIEVSFQGTAGGSNATPSSFTLNGVTCSIKS
jgi:anti-sigma regulatory factor (Ser/Thr protein kinase)